MHACHLRSFEAPPRVGIVGYVVAKEAHLFQTVCNAQLVLRLGAQLEGLLQDCHAFLKVAQAAKHCADVVEAQRSIVVVVHLLVEDDSLLQELERHVVLADAGIREAQPQEHFVVGGTITNLLRQSKILNIALDGAHVLAKLEGHASQTDPRAGMTTRPPTRTPKDMCDAEAKLAHAASSNS